MLPPGLTMLASTFWPGPLQVINVCSDQRLLDSLRDCNKLLDMVQKGLSEYLETKRGAFPRWVPPGPCQLCWCLPSGLGREAALTHSLTPVPLADSTSCQMMNYSRFCPRQRTPQPCSPTCASASRTLPG